MDSCLGVLEAAGGMLLLRNRLGSRRDEMAVGRGVWHRAFRGGSSNRVLGACMGRWSGGVSREKICDRSECTGQRGSEDGEGPIFGGVVDQPDGEGCDNSEYGNG